MTFGHTVAMLKVLATTSALIALGLFGSAYAADHQIPSTARKVVLERAETGYQWNLIEALCRGLAIDRCWCACVLWV